MMWGDFDSSDCTFVLPEFSAALLCHCLCLKFDDLSGLSENMLVLRERRKMRNV